jgi:peptidyl-prolyl cis-trans isomerase A (cyclophilin A)
MRRRCCLALAGAGVLAGRVCAAPAGATMVEMRTALGDIVLVLFARQAPLSAGAFMAVVAAGGYDGGAFTRVVRPGNDHGLPRISVAQGAARPGGPKAPSVPQETTRATGLRHLDGTISLPRDAVGTATGAEFFICVGDQPALDFGGLRNKDGQGFAAFGRVLRGMEVVRRIWSGDATGPSTDPYTAGQMLRVPAAILSARGIA